MSETTTEQNTAAESVEAAEAPAPAKKAPAKKAAAKKAPAKKAAAKKAPAKKAAAAEATAEPVAAEGDAPVEKAAAKKAPAKKAAAKKAAAKKAPAKKAPARKPAAKPVDEALPLDASPITDAAEAAEAPAATEAAATDAGATTVLFQAPETPKRTRTRKPAAKKAPEPVAETGPETPAEAADQVAGAVEVPAEDAAADVPAGEAQEQADVPAGEAQEQVDAQEADAEETDAEDGDEAEDAESDDEGQPRNPNRRRRRRGGRRRRKPGDANGEGNGEAAADSEGAETTESGEDAPAEAGTDNDSEGDSEGGDGTSTRRRRRRVRAGESASGEGDDPENTVTRVRQGRSAEDQITAVSGSTRLEAKKQRRREGREAGRRRAPIVSEAEFLARREAVERVMVIRQREDLTQIAVLEDKVLVEHYVARESQTSLIGNVYLGRVQNVLPSMEAAFIDIGKGRNAVLYAGEVNWSALGHKEGQPRKIENVLSSGQTVLVQVTKDPIGHKGARLTSQVSLAGRFLVYVPDGTTSGISRKLPDTERARLKALLKEIVPDTAGVIVRTAAEGAAEDELTRDVERLKARWEEIEKHTQGDAKGNAPRLLYGEPDLTLKVVRDLFTEDFSKLVIQGDDAWNTVQQYVAHVAPDLEDRLEQYAGDDVFATYRVQEQIAKGLDRKVWLPSGGSLIIDRTEAMTVVDVNTGKFTGSGGNLEETVTKNNLEAAEEVVRQLRLRDIGGIIVVDFIDMVLESNRDLVLRRLVECLGRDRTRHQVAEVTSLGLVQMTRKRIGTGLLEAFSETCEHCHGSGHITHAMPIEPKKSDDGGNQRGGNRRNRGRGGNGAQQEQGAKAPSPADVAAIAHAPEDADAQAADAVAEAAVDAVVATPAVDEPTQDAAQPDAQDTAAPREAAVVPEFLPGEPDLRELRAQQKAEEEAAAAAEAERKAAEAAERKAARDAERQAQREARAAERKAAAEAAALAEAEEAAASEEVAAADDADAALDEEPVVAEPEVEVAAEVTGTVAPPATEEAKGDQVEVPAAPAATTTVVTRQRRAVRRAAGSTAGAAPEPVQIVVAPPVAVEPAAAPEPPRVITRTRKAATRAAGAGVATDAGEQAGETASAELHVPVKKNSRKR
ncbi:Rne/Rng family ribonuclease [Nocardioides jiangxiensis]|uniref:Rne/Rng family ribonuclease n=1 Tax=Nocardioides jiangxiensis TaxID=3064524 RepID=UPI0034E211B4